MKFDTSANKAFLTHSFLLGLMRIKGKSVTEVKTLLEASLALGINYFDHADIYGAGKCESYLPKP